MTALDPGTLFANRFEIERHAGSGGMGAVYRARDRHTGYHVALKLLHAEGGHWNSSERFAREGRLLAELSHPGIVAYVAHGQAPDGRLFLAMEWLDGEDLGERLTRGPLAVRDCVDLLRHVAEALAVAHRRGVVHRDLKPGNLFLVGCEVGRVKVLDFGIARRVEASRAMTRTGALLGTPSYMAPEQARAGDITSATDVFSLGCVLYECLTGEPPFVAEHVAGVLARILFEDPVPLETRLPGVPAPLAALVRRMLEKQPTLRVSDADAVLAALDTLGELPTAMAAMATTEEAPPTKPLLFAEHEQGLFSLVVAAQRRLLDDDATVASDDALAGAERRSTVRSALAAMGVRADFMADGSLVVKVLGTGSATDQVAHAARAALVVKEGWPMANVALATGRGAVEGPFTVGEVADRAVRLLRHLEPSGGERRSGVRVDELSARLLGPRFALTPSPESALLMGEEKEADATRPLLGKPTPCVGREAELGSLEAQIAGCVEASEARAVLVTAPPGAGKSRLRHELLRRIEKGGDPFLLLAGRGEAMSAGAPYGMLAAAIRGLSGVGGGAPLEERRRLLRERVGRHVAEPERERVVRFVGEMCDIPFADEGMPMLQAARQEPKIMGDCLRRALLDWLAAESGRGLVLVVLDDLQWGDALTVSVVNEALQEQAGAPLFVLALARPDIREVFPRLWNGHKVQEIVLRGLSRKACERLIHEVLGNDTPREALERAIDQSGGNALFLEELIRAIAEGRAEDYPETVVAMLQARIGRLPAGPRRAIRAASVFGQRFWDGGVAAVLGLPKAVPEVTGCLSALVDAELVHSSPASRFPGEKEHSFKHALMREAAYGLLTPSDLAAGHFLAGEFLQAAGEHDAVVVAEHFEHGRDPKRAAAFYLRAAEESLLRGDHAGARRLCARGFGCEPVGEVLGRLQSVVCCAGFYLNSYEGTGEAARSAMALLRPGSLGWCRAMLAAIYAASDDPGRMIELLSLLGGTDPEPDARVAYIEAESYVSPIIVYAAPEPVVDAYLDRLASCVDLASETIPAARRYLFAVRGILSITRYPRPWGGIMDLGQAVRLAQDVGDQKTELMVSVNTPEIGWLDVGDFEGAHQRMLALEERLSRSQEGTLAAAWAIYFARILCEAPEEQAWDKAEALIARALSNTSGLNWFPPTAQGILARVALLRGQLEKAEELSRAAMEMLSLAPVFWVASAPVHVRALIGLGRAADACLVAEQVKGIFQTFGGAGSYEVEARLAIVEAFVANGDRERARAELGETLRQVKLREDDITDPFWRESYLTRNPYCARVLALGRAWGVDAG